MQKKLLKNMILASGTIALCSFSLLLEQSGASETRSVERTTRKAISRNYKPKPDKYTPRAGERTGVVSKTTKSRLNKKYWTRIKNE